MMPENRKYTSIKVIPSIFAASGILKLPAVLKTVLSVCRIFKPNHRHFHSPKESEAFKTTAAIKRNSGAGPGPPL